MSEKYWSTTMMKFAASLLAVASLGLFAPAQSATLDLTSVPAGITGGPDLNLSLAHFHSDIALFNTIRPSGAYLCGLGLTGDCRGDMSVTFTLPFVNVSFITTGWNAGDNVVVHAFNGITDLGSAILSDNGLVNLASFGTITSLLFDDSSTAAGAGASFGNFQISLAGNGNPDNGTDVPLPAALPMLVAGLGALGGVRRLRRN
jgi:hypothetical protein